MSLMMTAIGVLIGLVAANFAWQLIIQKRNWIKAAERSLFQIVAVAAVVGVYAFRS